MFRDPFDLSAKERMSFVRKTLAGWRTTLSRCLGFSAARARDLDREQAILRVVIALFVFIYASYILLSGEATSFSPLIAVVCGVIVESAGLWQLWWFRCNPERPAWMRYFGIWADLIPLTAGLWAAGEPGVPAISVYLWVTVGNGFRFGTRYLLVAYWTSLVCFSAILLTNPFWRQHVGVGVGFGLVLATIPLYVLVLLSRLTAQKDAAIQLSNAKSRFVANVSHELRTPLAGVFAVYDLLRRRRLGDDDRELVGTLGSAIVTLRTSVDAVLQMSKLEAGAERDERRLFNLRYFLRQLGNMVRPQALAKHLSWRLDVDAEVPGTVVGDSSHLQHILGNLINNALKFTPEGSVTLRVQPAPRGIRFEVSDTGVGIPLDKQETLFERFVQADSSPTRRFGGTGLGTSIAHDLVKLMGGNIGVNSAPGHGATFWVELPFGDVAQAAVPADWGERQDVLVLGPPGGDRDAIAAALKVLGLNPIAQAAEVENAPSFATTQYLAALLVLPATDAAVYIDTVLRDRTSSVCPWLVVTRACTATQAAVLLKSGASGLLPTVMPPEDWRKHLAALGNRIDLHATEPDAPLPAVAQNLHILLADDNQSNRMLMARILADAGHRVSHAEDGGQAYDVMIGQSIDVAILDLNMPDMSGADIAKLFRAGEIGSGKRLPIIILSADATPAAREESLASGANDFVVKPVTQAVLLGAIERIMAGVRLRQQTAAGSLLEHSAPPAVQLTLVSSASKLTPAAMLVDQERIAALRRIANDDPKFLEQYSSAAFDDLELALKELRQALQNSDAQGARDALHKIDGTASSIGALAMEEGAKAMRQYLSSGLDSDAAAALAELLTTCALTKSTVVAVMRREPHRSNRPQ